MSDIKKEIQNIGISGVQQDEVLEKLKIHIYKVQLERLLNALEIFQKAEKRLKEEIDKVNIKEVINIEKTLVKALDSIQSLLRQFEPSLREKKEIKDIMKDLNITEDMSSEEILKKVISIQVANLLKATHEAHEEIQKHKIGSMQRWKAEQSFKELSAVVLDLAKTLAKLQEETGKEEDFSMEEVVKLYEQYVEEK